jgi:cupredoxin-like protein
MTSRATPLALVIALIAMIAPVAAAPIAIAAEGAPAVRFQDGRFTPATFNVHAGQALSLRVVNQGSAPIEFESFELNRERVVQPGQEITVFIPPLQPGTYKFFDDFHHDAGEGAITAQ